MTTRFALDDGSGLRAARWLGRVVALLALWPLWYAFFGKVQFDWEAMMFGGPGVLIGLWLWGFAGYRIRNPRVFLAIDRQAGVARLQQGEDGPIVVDLEQLGAWTYASWKTIGSGKHRTVTTWHAARCPGFGEHNLYVGLDAKACRAWCTRVDAAVRGEARVHTETATIGELLAARFDAAIAASGGSPTIIMLTAATGLTAYASVDQIARTDGETPEAAVALAIVMFVLTLGWRAVRGPALAAAIAAVVGLGFVSKPWLAPVSYELLGSEYELSPSAEMHLYYVIPGLGLCVVAVALLSTIKVRKPTPAPRRSEPIELERPRPPSPPPSSRGEPPSS